jgi:hypothetical protein
MSFGWSAGDIVLTLKVLYKVGAALKDSGGASSNFQNALSFLQTLSRTLEHLVIIQSTPLGRDMSENLREQCDHIKKPLGTFLSEIERRYPSALGSTAKPSTLSAARKVQWGLFRPKKLKLLQERIAVPMAAIGLIQLQIIS